jgi:hypothetical protein
MPEPSTKSEAPVAGALFRAALKTPLSNGRDVRDRRKLLALLGAYADAGASPGAYELARRLRLPGHRQLAVRRLDRLLAQLEHDGVLTVDRPDADGRRRKVRNRYALTLDPDPKGEACDAAQGPRHEQGTDNDPRQNPDRARRARAHKEVLR